MSKHLDQATLRWTKEGAVELIDSNLNSDDVITLTRDDDFTTLIEDEYVNQEEWESQLDIEENCADGLCDDEIQRTHLIEYNVRFHFQYFENSQNIHFSCSTTMEF